MIQDFLLTILGCLMAYSLSAQVGIGTTSPNSSAVLELQSTSQGFLPPRMTAVQRKGIESPVQGLLVFQTDAPAGYYYYTGTNWVSIESAGAGSNSSSTCIDYDGNAYPTISIGTQTWIAENLRVTHYRNGDDIPNVTDNSEWTALTTGAYCWYNNDPSTYGNYGILYNWYAVHDSRELCPVGYHVATDAEYSTLTTYIGGLSIAGGKMKTDVLWTSPNIGATNISRFSGLPDGYRSNLGDFYSLGDQGGWWTYTAFDISNAWGYSLFCYDQYVHRGYDLKGIGYSVRCLRD